MTDADSVVPVNPTQKRITLGHAALEATRDFYAQAVAELMQQSNQLDEQHQLLVQQLAACANKLLAAETELRLMREMRISLKSLLDINSDPMTKEDLVDLTRRARGIVNAFK